MLPLNSPDDRSPLSGISGREASSRLAALALSALLHHEIAGLSPIRVTENQTRENQIRDSRPNAVSAPQRRQANIKLQFLINIF